MGNQIFFMCYNKQNKIQKEKKKLELEEYELLMNSFLFKLSVERGHKQGVISNQGDSAEEKKHTQDNRISLFKFG